MMPSQVAGGAKAVRRTPVFQDLKTFLIDLTGLGYYRDKEDRLAQYVHKRLSTLDFNLAQYFDFIRSAEGRNELDGLIDEIAIGETYFFRNPAQFDVLGSGILPDRIAARESERSLKIWSAGCATGAEPYSISILLERDWPEVFHSWDINLVGTDICEARLDQARRAVFTEWEMRGLPEDIRSSCFKRQGKYWHLLPRYARRVAFAQQNLKDIVCSSMAGRAGSYDIIFCRNVLIYFDVGLMRQVLAGLRELLVDGGWLLVGHAEPYFEIAHYLTPVIIDGTTAYRRLDSPAARGTSPPPAKHDRASLFPEPPPAPAPVEAPALPADEPPAWHFPPDVSPLLETPGKDTEKPADQLKAVRHMADAGKWPDASGACKAYVAKNPLDPAGHFILALILEHCGAMEAAQEGFKRVVYLDRTHALAHFHIARLHLNKGECGSALRSFANVIDLVSAVKADTPVQDGDGMLCDELGALVRHHVERLTI